jgi:hypothetical protein
MLYKEIISIYSESYEEDLNAQVWYNLGFLNFKPGGTQCYQWTSKGNSRLKYKKCVCVFVCVCVCVCLWPVYSLLLDVVTNDNTPHHEGAWVNGGIIPHILDLGVDFHLRCQTAVLPEKDRLVAIL